MPVYYTTALNRDSIFPTSAHARARTHTHTIRQRCTARALHLPLYSSYLLLERSPRKIVGHRREIDTGVQAVNQQELDLASGVSENVTQMFAVLIIDSYLARWVCVCMCVRAVSRLLANFRRQIASNERDTGATKFDTRTVVADVA